MGIHELELIDLEEEDFKVEDKYYPLIVYVVVKKNG